LPYVWLDFGDGVHDTFSCNLLRAAFLFWVGGTWRPGV